MRNPAEIAPSRWVIIGGNGFIGTNLVHQLSKGQTEIIVIGRRPPRWPVIQEGVRYVQLDYRDTAAIRPYFIPGSALVHMANMSYLGKMDDLIKPDFMDDVLGTVQLAQAAADSGVTSFVFLSSGGAVYGDQTAELITETALPRPINAYGTLKLTIEHYLHLMHRLTGLPVTSLRVSNVYGSWHPGTGQGVVNVFLHRLRKSELIELWGDGSQIRDYIHVSDVCNAIASVSQKHERGFATWNIGTGVGMTVKEVLAVCERVSGQTAQLNQEEIPFTHIRRNVLDIHAFKSAYDWEPNVPFEEGVRDVWHWTDKTFRT